MESVINKIFEGIVARDIAEMTSPQNIPAVKVDPNYKQQVIGGIVRGDIKEYTEH